MKSIVNRVPRDQEVYLGLFPEARVVDERDLPAEELGIAVAALAVQEHP
jgi:hypothetical protein